MKSRGGLAIRWALFFTAVFSFVHFVFFDSASPGTLGLFALSGGLWYRRVRGKMRELDGPSRE